MNNKFMVMKNGFLMFSFCVYLGLYVFFCGIIFYFCSFCFQSMYIARSQAKAFYVYHSVYKNFMNDAFTCNDVEIDTTKIVFSKDTCNVIWTIKNNCLIRKELFHKKSTPLKNIVYLCTIVHAFQPFLREYENDCFFVGFKVKFFNCPFTISTLGQRSKKNEKI